MLPLAEVVRHVRRQRRMLGLSQNVLARDAGTSQSFIAKLEQGRLNPSYEAVRRVMEGLEDHMRREEPRAKDLMQKDPLWVEPRERAGEALARMKEHGFSQLPVLDRGQPVGSLSEAIILEHIERGEDFEDLKTRRVGSVMRGGFPTVDPETRRRVLVEILRENPLVLVVEQGRVQGVVTKSDLW